MLSPTAVKRPSKPNIEDPIGESFEKKSDHDSREYRNSLLSEESKFHKEIPYEFTDEYFDFKLQQQRLQMSMRRNILRRNLSEDLIWADCMKNEFRPKLFTDRSARKKKPSHFL